MNVLLIGPLGSGKSTQAGFLAERLMIPRITASGVLKAAAQTDSTDVRLIRQTMDAGALVPERRDALSGQPPRGIHGQLRGRAHEPVLGDRHQGRPRGIAGLQLYRRACASADAPQCVREGKRN